MVARSSGGAIMASISFKILYFSTILSFYFEAI